MIVFVLVGNLQYMDACVQFNRQIIRPFCWITFLNRYNYLFYLFMFSLKNVCKHCTYFPGALIKTCYYFCITWTSTSGVLFCRVGSRAGVKIE